MNVNSKEHVAYLDLRSENKYTEMTLCIRANFRSFFPNDYNKLFSITGVEEEFTWPFFYWEFVIFEPFHSMRDLGKQVCVHVRSNKLIFQAHFQPGIMTARFNNTMPNANKGPWWHFLLFEEEVTINRWHSFCISYSCI